MLVRSQKTALIFSLVIISAVAAIGLLFGQSQEAKPPRVAPLVQQLGDDKFAARQEATRELHDIGEAAIPALIAAANNSDDAEVRWRAKQLVHSIMMFSKSTGMEWALVEAGEFQMGSPAAEKNRREDELAHPVRITKPFLIGKHEVTQLEYDRVMKANPSYFTKDAGGSPRVAREDTRLFPVERVTWFDAIEFCNRLSELDKLPPYYRLSAVERAGGSIKRAAVDVRGGAGYRLPTEAEWEYAARAGSKTRFYFGEANSGREANVKPEMVAGGYGGPTTKFRDYARTTEVGSFPTNAWGLADMHGNVSEWCWDWYDKDYYANSPAENPQGPSRGTARVQRGGSWLMQEDHARSASRMFLSPDDKKEYAGFRVARTPELTLQLQQALTNKGKP
jgi:sulfatase modifying factor 1